MWAENYNAQLRQEEPLPYRTTVYLPVPDQSAVPHAMTTSVLSLPTMVPAQAFVVVTSPQGNHIQPYVQQQLEQPMWSLEQPPPQAEQQLLTQTSDLKENQKNQSKKSKKKLHRYGASPEMLKSGSAFPSYYADPQKLWHPYYLNE